MDNVGGTTTLEAKKSRHPPFVWIGISDSLRAIDAQAAGQRVSMVVVVEEVE
jgi:hypothetical protein